MGDDYFDPNYIGDLLNVPETLFGVLVACYLEKDLEEWEIKKDLPFNERPMFGPVYSQKDLENFRKEIFFFYLKIIMKSMNFCFNHLKVIV